MGPCLESPVDGLQGEASVHCLPPPSVLRAPPFCLLSAALVYVLMRRNIFTISSSFFFFLIVLDSLILKERNRKYFRPAVFSMQISHGFMKRPESFANF